MSDPSVPKWGPRLVPIVTSVTCVAILGLAWFGLHAMTEWRDSSSKLVRQWEEDSADLLLSILTKDMRGAQAFALTTSDSIEFTPEYIPDIASDVAEAFARYPYPESFFGWDADEGSRVIFFTRASRQPSWITSQLDPGHYPVTITESPQVAGTLFDRIRRDQAARKAYSIFATEIDGTPYQVVARLAYDNPMRDRLAMVIGFMVNLNWIREQYFADLVSEASRIRQSDVSLSFAVADEHGTPVVGGGGLTGARRQFPLAFFDPLLVGQDLPRGFNAPRWNVRVMALENPTTIWATRGADWILVTVAAMAFGLAATWVLIARAFRTSASLTAMRADFVSTVTHELKTPLAAIRTVGDTLVRRRNLEPAALQRYAGVLVRESKRLTRLVENLLAYARVTDATDVYSFEPLVPTELVEDAVRDFKEQLADGRFEVVLELPDDLPMVPGDRTFLRLALDNLIDNAIRYSADTHVLRVAVSRSGRWVRFEVSDRGPGIPPEEIEAVQQRFARGRTARSRGSGLGLSIVKRVAAAHGGTFTLMSTVGVGTTARIDVPLHRRD